MVIVKPTNMSSQVSDKSHAHQSLPEEFWYWYPSTFYTWKVKPSSQYDAHTSVALRVSWVSYCELVQRLQAQGDAGVKKSSTSASPSPASDQSNWTQFSCGYKRGHLLEGTLPRGLGRNKEATEQLGKKWRWGTMRHWLRLLEDLSVYGGEIKGL